jgi:heterodisulfide reductase subunit D
MTTTFQNILQTSGAAYCLECGKCSAVCPVTRWETADFASPRRLVEGAVLGRTEEVFNAPLFWSCLTCNRCRELCPSAVHFSEFIRDARGIARESGRTGACTHGDVIHTWSRIMTDPALRQNRLGWLTAELGVSETSDTIFFAGCLPHYDALFEELDVEGVKIARAAVRLLNAIGIFPRVLAGERCCGHDQLWQGEFETFRKLGRLNLDLLVQTGARRIVTACPECARTLARDYPRFIGGHGLDVYHITEILDRALSEGLLEFDPPGGGRRITYQDPCRLGRHLGIFDAPRTLIEAAGHGLVEMAHAKRASICCGTSCWTACGQVNKHIQAERLKEAKAAGADLLVTACVKCQIHFKCAQQGPAFNGDIEIEIQDITTLLAQRLRKKAVL